MTSRRGRYRQWLAAQRRRLPALRTDEVSDEEVVRAIKAVPRHFAGIAHVHTDTTGDVNAPGNITLTQPTGVVSTDVCILMIGSDNGGAGSTSGSYTMSANWTAAFTHYNVVTGGKPGMDIACYWTLGSRSGADLTATKTGTVSSAGWVMACFSGCDTVNPIDAAGTGSNVGTSGPLTVNAVTANTTGAIEIIVMVDNNTGAPSFAITGFTISNNGDANFDAALAYNTATTISSGASTGTKSLSDSAGANLILAVPFLLKPASSGADNLDWLTNRWAFETVEEEIWYR